MRASGSGRNGVTTDKAKTAADLTWYHTIELPGGVTTPGIYDLRKVVSRVLPDDLSGKRCLDAATSSGFWAFEMEKRGAAEVVAIDVDSYESKDFQFPWTTPEGVETQKLSFEFAKEALGSKVERKVCNLYDVSPERLGTFDFVFIGSVLLHLRDPVAVLRNLRTVTRGELRSFDVELFWGSLLHPRRPMAALAQIAGSRWWTPNAAGHRRWMLAGGFEITGERHNILQPFGAGGKAPVRLSKLNRARLRYMLGERTFGVPSGWISARPRPGN
jgi:tRNA (mo5U34)-methyltransferase